MQVPIRPFRHFFCWMYRLATKRVAKNEVGNIVNVFMDSG